MTGLHHPQAWPEPAERPVLDPGFRPLALALGSLADPTDPPRPERDPGLRIVLHGAGGRVDHHWVPLPRPGSPGHLAARALAERVLKFLIWSRGAARVQLAGEPELAARLAAAYRPGGARAFDADLMTRAYATPFAVTVHPEPELAPPRPTGNRLGGHWAGCRLGFDLGASDYKLAAVIDGQPVFTTETRWHPVSASDPAYHLDHLRRGLALAARHLPRVDAIGGSTAGIVLDGEPRVASLFRSVPAARFETDIRPMFHTLAAEYGVPLAVANDGDVSALAGGLALGRGALLGLALGSSEAAGFIDPAGRLTGWLNELAFAPIDLNPDAPADEWSGDRGVGASYLSQQAVGRLVGRAGLLPPDRLDLPELLQWVQELAGRGDPAATRVFDTVGAYLGHAVALYARFYEFRDVLILGRVASGSGGEQVVTRARQVLAREYPDLAVHLHVPDEQTRRLGQAVAAASLPEGTAHG